MKENNNYKELRGNDAIVDTYDLENNEILQIKDDRLFHDLFNKHELSTIEWLVSGIPLEEVKGKVTPNTERLAIVRATERSKYVDLLVFYKDEFILIELNNNYSGNPIKNLMYATNLLSSYYDFEIDEDKTDISLNMVVYKRGKKKVFVKPSRGILVNFNWYPPKATKRKREIPGKIITDWNFPADSAPEFQGYCLKIININLDYYANLCYDNVTEEEKVFKLLAIDNEKDLNKISKDVPELKNYVSKLKNLSKEEEYRDMLMNERVLKNIIKQDEDFQKFAMGRDIGDTEGEKRGKALGLKEGKTIGLQEGKTIGLQEGKTLGLQEGKTIGLQEGKTLGIEQNRHDMILEMHKKGLSIDLISDISKLSEMEVNEIIAENANDLKK